MMPERHYEVYIEKFFNKEATRLVASSFNSNHVFGKLKSVDRFKEKIYSVVRKIPKGSVLTYKDVSERAGRPRAWRAAGNVLNKNRDPKIPCHRVIRSDGKPGGYAGGGKNKIHILKREGVVFP